MKTQRNWLPLIIVTIVFSFTLIVLKPAFANALNLRGKNKESKKKFSQLVDKIQKLEAIDNNEIERKVELVEEIYPSKKPALQLVAALQLLSQEENLAFGGIEIRPGKIGESQEEKEDKFEVSFSIEGSLESISVFINKLEKTAPLMNIEGLSLTFKDEEGKTDLLQADLLVNVFFLSPPETIGAIDQPLAILNEEESESVNKLSSFRLLPRVQTTAPVGRANPFTL